MSWPVHFIHGDAIKGSRTKLYGVWATMLSRCRNPNSTEYENYGARGIRVCRSWEDYTIFRAWALANDYREGLEIDRRRVNGNYCPSNCRWRPFKIDAAIKDMRAPLFADRMVAAAQKMVSMTEAERVA